MVTKNSISIIGSIIKKDDIARFLSIFEELNLKYSLEISFNDDTSIDEVKLSEFLKQPFDNKVIKKIAVSSYNSDYKTDTTTSVSLSVEKGISYLGNYLSFSSSSFEIYSILNTKFEQWIGSIMSKKRRPLLSMIKVDLLLTIFFSIVSTVFVVIGIYNISKIDNLNVYFLLSPISFFVFFFLYKWFFSFLKKCYPDVEIDIGANEAKNRRHFVWVFFSVFLLPFVFMLIGIFANR